MMDQAISVRNVSKVYRIWRTPAGGFKAPALAALAQCLGRGSALSKKLYARAASYYRDFPALTDITLDVAPGECVGIIGRNGSGKSTLLQIIAGTLTPTAGQVEVNGRVTALLELGSGFNPDFTGRDNVYLNGSILGIRKEEMDRKFDEIAAFADIGDFIDQPVKTYSSGMVVRLAFAVQVLVEPQVLIVDEALAVGDIFFRQKCFEHMRKLLDRGVAILLVTHDMSAVTQFCRRAMVLNRGMCRFIGPADQAAKYYQIVMQEEDRPGGQRASAVLRGVDSATQAGTEMPWPEARAMMDVQGRAQFSNGWARCLRVALCDATGRPCSVFEQGETGVVYYEFEALRDLECPSGGVTIQDATGQTIHTKHQLQQSMDLPLPVKAGARLRYRQEIQFALACGQYTYDAGLLQMPRDLVASGRISDEAFQKECIRIIQTERFGPFQVVLRRDYQGFQVAHWGLTDLSGRARCEVVEP